MHTCIYICLRIAPLTPSPSTSACGCASNLRKINALFFNFFEVKWLPWATTPGSSFFGADSY